MMTNVTPFLYTRVALQSTLILMYEGRKACSAVLLYAFLYFRRLTFVKVSSKLPLSRRDSQTTQQIRLAPIFKFVRQSHPSHDHNNGGIKRKGFRFLNT